MDSSIFMDKAHQPNDDLLKEGIGDKYSLWKSIRDLTFEKYPNALEEWNFPGKKYGWSFRIKDKKRAIIYLLPRDNNFKVAFVFGQKATDKIMASNISQSIKDELMNAKVYAEGRGIKIDVNDDKIINDVKTLIDIKLAF